LDWAPALSFAVLLLLTLTQARRPLQGKTWTYLRSLFPSWRFFDDVEPGPVLEFRIESEDALPTEWQAALATVQRAGLFLNAEGNLRLAYQSLVEQLVGDLDGVEVTAAPSLVAYRLAQCVVQERARALGLMRPRGSYRMRVRSGGEIEFESEGHAL
jgi:hypothetical protein